MRVTVVGIVRSNELNLAHLGNVKWSIRHVTIVQARGGSSGFPCKLGVFHFSRTFKIVVEVNRPA